MTRGGRGRGRGDRGRGTSRRGRPKKRTGIPLDLGEPAAGTSAPTPVPVVPTSSPAEGGPTIRMIPTPGSSRVHSSSDTTGTRSQRQSSAQTSGGGGGGHRLGGGARQAGWSYLPPLGREFVPQFSMASDEMVRFCLSFAYSAGMRAGSIPLGFREPPRDSVTYFTRSATREHLTRGYEMTCGTSWSSFGGKKTSRSSRRSTSRTGRPRRVDYFI
ncbi:hypothetical protein PIB30_102277 [Stylosanthes scabra]|uniref:Uncharacterized protein n=1 Tax=Stylosanthes scabra TaxID=79078 RepID=A0ABU6V076_9FABA|nr:hypothetical protein [Stylosanthes scabra]